MSDKEGNTAGGSPASGHFLLRRQKKVTQEKATPVYRPSGSLDQPQASGAAQLALAGSTQRAPLRSSDSARLNLRLLAADRGGAQGIKSESKKSKAWVGNKLPTHAESR